MAIALYRKYRSRRLDDIVGQEHVTDVLRRAIDTDRVAHAYLFTGPRGVGKTSIARILAHEINDLPYDDESSHLDIIEIDAASNNGVDDIRDLREKVQLAPSSAKKKVYIIDEVHMLSKAAFNALLKTLEEPPEHVVFILATTDVDKLPATIVSRTQRHSFRRASIDNLVKNLSRIAKKESLLVTKDALRLIAEHSDGSYRDSVSLLDQLANTVEPNQKVTSDSIEHTLGLAPGDIIDQLIGALDAHDFDEIVSLTRQTLDRGILSAIIAGQLVARITGDPATHSGLLSYVDQLIAVRQSPLPDASLLVALTSASEKPVETKATPVAAPVNKIVAIASLEQKATQDKPVDDLVAPAAHPHTPQASEPFDWQRVIDAAKDESIGLSSVVNKCSAVLQADKLIIYSRTEFYKKKLETARMSQLLHKILKQCFGREYDIEIIPGVMTLANSQLASAAAIMGGGEEVDVEGV